VVVLVVEITSDRAAFRGRDPKIGAASVEDDLELLWRSANGNFQVVLSVEEVDDWYWMTVIVLGLVRVKPHLLCRAWRVNANVLLAERRSMLIETVSCL